VESVIALRPVALGMVPGQQETTPVDWWELPKRGCQKRKGVEDEVRLSSHCYPLARTAGEKVWMLFGDGEQCREGVEDERSVGMLGYRDLRLGPTVSNARCRELYDNFGSCGSWMDFLSVLAEREEGFAAMTSSAIQI
jgi:hypothetical protein